MNHPRIVIAATKSGSGKTLLTCALLDAIKKQGKTVSAFKCGPDYIDPMFHQRVIGIPSKNLDLFFTSEDRTRQLFWENLESDISVIEGVMGLYDGIGGIYEEASTYHLAKTLQAPVILVINAHGMGRSMIAEIKGFLDMDTDHLIKGVILNQISAMFYQTIRPVIEEETGIEVLGYFEKQKDIQLESRHLGLKLPHEVEELKEMVNRAGDALMQGIDMDRLLCLAQAAPKLAEDKLQEIPFVGECCIGIARDEAFSFYYQDNLKLLEKMGAKLVPFSPIHDEHLPEGLDGLLLGGGYPELKARDLEANRSMRQDLREAISNKKLPTLAECGGFMYLHESLVDDKGDTYEMCGVIEGTTHFTGKLVRFGYIELSHSDWKIRGHEFHYYDSSNNGKACLAKKPYSNRFWETSFVEEGSCMGYPHLYYPSNPEFAEAFVKACLRNRDSRGEE